MQQQRSSGVVSSYHRSFEPAREALMARKRSARSGSRRSAKKSRQRKKPPQGWIRIVWGQVVRKVSGGGNIQLRLKPRTGAARSIALSYALTKKALGK